MTRFLAIAAATILTAFSLSAQNASNQLGDFSIERVLTLSSAFAPTPPNFPAPVLANLQNGNIELHQVFAYSSAQRTLEQTAYVVPGKSPLPFPSLSSAPIGDHYIIQVDSSTRSATTASISGHVMSNDILTPWGDITGALVTITFAYQGTGPSTKFSDIVESVTGFYGLYTPVGVGSLSTTPADQKCTNATLNGVYMFQLNGAVQTTPTTFGPFVDSGRMVADGNGNLTVLDSGNIGGNGFVNRTFPITYAFDEYCSGTFKWSGASMDVQVSKDGRRVNMIFTSPASVVANGTAQLQ